MSDRHTVSLNDLLNSCIEVESLKISQKLAIPKQICFRLNHEIITAIEQFEVNQEQFKLSPANLTILRCYALFNLTLGAEFNQTRQLYLSQSCLIFSTQYTEDETDSGILLRSTVDPKGKILQQIKQELLQNPLLLERVLKAHCWLSTAILTQLPIKQKKSRNWSIYISLTVAVAVVCSLIWYLLPQIIIKLAICLFLIGLLVAIAFGKRLKSQITNLLVIKVFSSRKIQRQLSLKAIDFLFK